MNIKKQVPRWMSVLLSLSMVFSGVLPAYATEAIITESALEGEELIEPKGEDIVTMENDIEAQADIESRYETVEVSYSQSSSYFVTIPKTITLGTDKKSLYSIKVEGDLVANKQVCVVPVDGIEDTEVFDFYMADQITGSTKADVVAEVSQAKFYWNHEEAANGYEENDNYIIADGLTAGKWKGTFQFEISMRTDPTHIHNYVGEVTKEPTCTEAGEKTYICDCGDSYTETIDPTGHHFEKGECTNCGEKDPDHEHQYTEVVTKQPTCIEDGERTYTCDCGDSYTEVIPATGHHYVDGECEHCGEKDPDAHEHSYTEEITKQPTCTEDGEKTYTCECGDTYTEKIPATGHNYVDGECEHCGEKDPDAHEHSYTEEITKQPTCTEDGEKTYTCECGDSYTEKIPATGHNFVDGTCTNCGEEDPCSKSHTDEDGDDVCDKCGHTHEWEENTDTISWTKATGSNSSNMLSQNGDKWTAKYTSNTYTINGYWDITVPEDVEYTFAYSATAFSTNDSLNIYLDGDLIVNVANSSRAASETVSLSKGEHRIRLTFNKKNTTFSSTSATITLEPIIVYNHICTECGEKEAHHYADGIVIKEPTCTEKGEKEFVCTKCNATKTEEIEALGHHYVDGVCDRCGSLNLVSTTIWSASASTSTTTDSGSGHYDKTYLAGTYSPNIEITEDMSEDEYLLLDFYVGIPFYGGASHTSETDGVNGSSMLQKYNEETDTWETVYSYGLAFSTIATNMLSQEGSYSSGSSGSGIRREFQLEKGTYRVYGRFSAQRGCGSSVAHYYYSYRISASLCQVEKEAVEAL